MGVAHGNCGTVNNNETGQVVSRESHLAFRFCCVSSPETFSKPDRRLRSWLNRPEFIEFRCADYLNRQVPPVS